MKKTFMKLKLSYRLFLIIIILFLVPYLLLFSWSYKKAENIIKEKIQILEAENMKQTRDAIDNLCTNIVKASDYLVSLDNYANLYNKSSAKDYQYLISYKTIDGLVQNVNNTLLNSCGEISVFSKNEILYSTISNQKLQYQDFYREQIATTSYFSSVHNSYHNFENNQAYISYMKRLPPFNNDDPFYLVISVPTYAFEKTLNTATGTMQLFDTENHQICATSDTYLNGEFQEQIDIPISGWKLVDTFSSDSMYKDIYHLRFFTFAVSFVLLFICLIATLVAISIQLKPLISLKKQMELVTLGNLNAQLPATISDDEISSLANAFNNMINEISALLEEIQITQKRESELRFEMLLAQINPHFLFNTMNSIKWMSVVAHTDNITNTITSLGRLLEISMNKVNDFLTIEDELTNIQSYIQIQTVRYPGRFEVNYKIDKDILSSYTLKLILQPLVENSILHNIDRRDYLIIEISGQISGANIVLHVKDNGIGISYETIEQILHKPDTTPSGKVFTGIGVYNVQERIQLAYGHSYGLAYKSDGFSYTDVIITFPNQKSPDAPHHTKLGGIKQ